MPTALAVASFLASASLGCAAAPPIVSAPPAKVSPASPPTQAVPEPAEQPKPGIVRVGAGEAVVVAPGQIVEGGWFRMAVFGDKSCGPSMGGGTLHAIDFFYDELAAEETRFFSKRATVELVNARGEAFAVVGGLLVGEGCGPSLPLGEGAKPGARLRGWPFAGLSAGAEPPTQVRLVLEEPHGFAVSTVTVDLGLPPRQPGALPERNREKAANSTGPGTSTGASPYFELTGAGLRSCTYSDDPWLDRVFAEARAEGKTMRIVGLDLRLENRSSESIDLTPMEVVDADGRGYSVYPLSRTSCELGRFPDQVGPRESGQGTVGFALVPAGTRDLTVRVDVWSVGKSPYDGYRPVTVRIPLGDVAR